MSEFSVGPSLKYPYPAQFLFSNKCSRYGTKQLLLDEIDREATKVWANAHLQKSLPAIGISLKTTQTFITIVWELYSMVFKPICKEFIFSVSKIFEVFCPLCYASYSARPTQSNYRTLSTEVRMDIPRVTLK